VSAISGGQVTAVFDTYAQHNHRDNAPCVARFLTAVGLLRASERSGT